MKANKPIYCNNAVWGDYGKISPIACFANMSSTSNIITSSTLQIVVTIENMVA